MTNKDLEPLDEGVEYIIKTEKSVLNRMNEWYVLRSLRSFVDEDSLRQLVNTGASTSMARFVEVARTVALRRGP